MTVAKEKVGLFSLVKSASEESDFPSTGSIKKVTFLFFCERGKATVLGLP